MIPMGLVRCARLLLAGAVVMGGAAAAFGLEGDKPHKSMYRGLLGPDSKKIRKDGDKTFLWAGGKPSGPGSQWYEFTEALIPADKLQFGIGKDRIRAIDDPLFVPPDDARLMELPPPGYGRGGKPASNDDIMVIGYVENGVAKAYPTALLDRHELVNDRIGGKPVTVGW